MIRNGHSRGVAGVFLARLTLDSLGRAGFSHPVNCVDMSPLWRALIESIIIRVGDLQWFAFRAGIRCFGKGLAPGQKPQDASGEKACNLATTVVGGKAGNIGFGGG